MTRYFRSLQAAILLGLGLAPAATEARVEPDSNFVRTFPGTVTVRSYLGEKFSTYTLMDRARGRELTFHPNSILGLGIGATILGIGFNFSARLPLHDTKIDRYGKTSRYDIQVHRYSRKLMLDAYLQRYRGFHLADKAEVTRITGPEEYPYFANLEGRSIGLSALHIFNGERYSLRALVNQQEWQRKSSGSALLGGSIFTHRFSEQDSSIIPRYYRYEDLLGGNRPTNINHYGITANGGYGYTLVLGKEAHFFLAGAADLGVGGAQSSVRDTLGNRQTRIDICVTANVRVGGGYNSDRWFAGIYGIVHVDYYSIPYEDAVMQRNQGIVRLVVARRIPTKRPYLARQPKPLPAEPLEQAAPATIEMPAPDR